MENNKKKDFLLLRSNSMLRNTVFILVAILLIIILIEMINRPLVGGVLLALTLIAMYLFYRVDLLYRDDLDEQIKNLSYRVKRGEQESLIKMPIGIILYEGRRIQWVNPYMIDLLDEDNIIGKSFNEIAPSLAEQVFGAEGKTEFKVNWNDKVFRVQKESENEVLYLLDITEYAEIEEKAIATQLVLGFLVLDNYGELTRELDDRETSRLDTMLTTYFSNWFRQRDIYYRRLESNRYLLLMNKSNLEKLEEDNFSIIDNIRERSSKRNVPLTVSIGLSYGDDAFDNLADTAQDNIDLALARGGDQAVVSRHGEDPSYYGGKSDPMIKRTRVRSRMITQALESQMIQSNKIFIMGHKTPDMDSIGAALGIRRIAELNEREAYIVIDQADLNRDVQQLIEVALENKDLQKYIISPNEAYKKADSDSLIILVDHHRPSLSIEQRLIDKSNRIVIIDHHRRGNEFPKNPLLVYIEPYASSTAELVAEMFEYVTGEGQPINKFEATALLGGIVVDSNNFSLRTGSRTFNAASYLQSVGADNVMIRDMLAEDYDVYMERTALIKNMDVYYDSIAIAMGEENHKFNPVITAQAADTLLSFSNIDTSFVITERPDGKVGISARSTGNINVQLIMEKMGGGGHLSNAATQVENLSLQEVKAELLNILEDYIDKL